MDGIIFYAHIPLLGNRGEVIPAKMTDYSIFCYFINFSPCIFRIKLFPYISKIKAQLFFYFVKFSLYIFKLLSFPFKKAYSDLGFSYKNILFSNLGEQNAGVRGTKETKKRGV